MKPAAKRKAKRGDLNSIAYSKLKELILSGRYKPGVQLVHDGLADQLSISRTPVREALERLSQDGYVERRPKRGYFVVEIRVSDVRNLYETREALELFAYRRICQKGFSAAAIAELEELNQRYTDVFPDGGTRERRKFDRDFHLKLASFCENDFMLKTLESVFEKIDLKRRLDGYGIHPHSHPYRDHDRLISVIKAGRFDEGDEILRAHIEQACARFLSHLNETAG